MVSFADIDEVTGRVTDRFHDVISRIMGEIEQQMRKRYGWYQQWRIVII